MYNDPGSLVLLENEVQMLQMQLLIMDFYDYMLEKRKDDWVFRGADLNYLYFFRRTIENTLNEDRFFFIAGKRQLPVDEADAKIIQKMLTYRDVYMTIHLFEEILITSNVSFDLSSVSQLTTFSSSFDLSSVSQLTTFSSSFSLIRTPWWDDEEYYLLKKTQTIKNKDLLVRQEEKDKLFDEWNSKIQEGFYEMLRYAMGIS
jgi:hypothetical protein